MCRKDEKRHLPELQCLHQHRGRVGKSVPGLDDEVEKVIVGVLHIAEIFRAGIQSIERGQIEAAKALGLNYFQSMRFIVLPQAIRRILPPLGNQLIYMLKMSSLISVIGMQELTRRANELVVTEYRPLEIYTFLLLEYLVLILIVSSGVRWLERHLAIDGY